MNLSRIGPELCGTFPPAATTPMDTTVSTGAEPACGLGTQPTAGQAAIAAMSRRAEQGLMS